MKIDIALYELQSYLYNRLLAVQQKKHVWPDSVEAQAEYSTLISVIQRLESVVDKNYPTPEVFPKKIN